MPVDAPLDPVPAVLVHRLEHARVPLDHEVHRVDQRPLRIAEPDLDGEDVADPDLPRVRLDREPGIGVGLHVAEEDLAQLLLLALELLAGLALARLDRHPPPEDTVDRVEAHPEDVPVSRHHAGQRVIRRVPVRLEHEVEVRVRRRAHRLPDDRQGDVLAHRIGAVQRDPVRQHPEPLVPAEVGFLGGEPPNLRVEHLHGLQEPPVVGQGEGQLRDRRALLVEEHDLGGELLAVPDDRVELPRVPVGGEIVVKQGGAPGVAGPAGLGRGAPRLVDPGGLLQRGVVDGGRGVDRAGFGRDRCLLPLGARARLLLPLLDDRLDARVMLGQLPLAPDPRILLLLLRARRPRRQGQQDRQQDGCKRPHAGQGPFRRTAPSGTAPQRVEKSAPKLPQPPPGVNRTPQRRRGPNTMSVRKYATDAQEPHVSTRNSTRPKPSSSAMNPPSCFVRKINT